MSDAGKVISERNYYRIGRHFFDGADAEWIAAREKISAAEVQKAMELCCRKLSHYFTAAAGDEFRVLSDTELRERTEDCVRLLLQWRETLIANERLAEAVRSRSDDDFDNANDEPA